MKKSLIAGAIACAFGPVQAEDLSTFDLGTIVVTPARTPQSLETALQSTTVITSGDIDRAGQQTLPELLRTLGNVEIGTNGGPGQTASVFIRGANSGHTVVLVDGVRMDNITSGTTAIEHIPLEQIERIEILRGPGSSLYGADAIGGVIQIFTKKPAGSGFDAEAGLGSRRTHKASLGVWQTVGDTTLRARLGDEATKAFSATNTAAGAWTFNPDDDPYRNRHLTASLEHRIDERSSVGLSLFHSRGVVHFDAGAGSDPVKVETLQQIAVHGRNRITEGWESTVRLAQSTDDYHWVNVSYGPVKSIQDQFLWQNDVKLGGGLLTAGLEYVAQRVSSATAYDRTRRHVGSIFALYRRQAGEHEFQLSARHDDNSQFGGHTTGSLAYGYRPGPGWRVSGSLGTAFRAPTFADLYYPGWGNPDLRPEKSLGGELAVRHTGSGHTASLTWFRNRIEDLIAFDWTVSKPTCPSGCPVNVKRAKTEGVELAVDTRLSGGFSLMARATLQQAVDADTGRRLARRAESHGSLRLAWQGGPWRAFAESVASGDRFDDGSETPSGRMGGYTLLNLGAEFAASRELTFLARWDNVFDRQYELAKGYNTPGSSVFVGLRYQPR